jgi:5-methylcytosine-specific restriction endonuclease McrA
MKRVGGYKWYKFRKELIRKRGYKCEKCGKETKRLIADHTQPIYLLGEEFNEKNVKLLCYDCDKKKTKVDLSIIHWMQSLDFT